MGVLLKFPLSQLKMLVQHPPLDRKYPDQLIHFRYHPEVALERNRRNIKRAKRRRKSERRTRKTRMETMDRVQVAAILKPKSTLPLWETLELTRKVSQKRSGFQKPSTTCRELVKVSQPQPQDLDLVHQMGKVLRMTSLVMAK